MVRAIATGDLRSKDWASATAKEILVGIFMGLAMGALAFIVGWLYGGESNIAQVIGFSMLIIVLVANIFGALLPFALDRMNIDPAVASSPLITSIMDVLGLIIYFSIAVILL
jgi:magnesium transporter